MRKCFSLVELLVVIAVMSILMSLLLPALRSARQTAARVSCGSNLRQLYQGVSMYVGDNNNWMPPCGVNGSHIYFIDEELNAKGQYSATLALGGLFFTKPGGIYFCPGTPWPVSTSPCWPSSTSPGTYAMSPYQVTMASAGGGGWYPSGFTGLAYRRIDTILPASAILSETNYLGASGTLAKTGILYNPASTRSYPSTTNTCVPAYNNHCRSANFLFLDGHVKPFGFTGRPLFDTNWLEL